MKRLALALCVLAVLAPDANAQRRPVPDNRFYPGELRPDGRVEGEVRSADGYVKISSGTGFFVDISGYIVTNEHVVRGCRFVNVKGEGKEEQAMVVAAERGRDLALVKVPTRPERVAALRFSSTVKKGEKALVIGYPGERGIVRKYVMTEAHIYDTDGPNGEGGLLQFSDTVARGNSGGPLLDTDANVVGVVAGKVTRFSQRGDAMYTTDIAINNDSLKRFLNEHNVGYNEVYTTPGMSNSGVEKLARDFIVSVHCYRSIELEPLEMMENESHR